MGTIIDRLGITQGGWRSRHSALHLAVSAANSCLHDARRDADAVDLLVNAGIYRDKNLAEPALAALIQEDIGANPEDPHGDRHGTFSFDISNGTCGILTGLQIVDGFLRSHTISCALITASDADPGRGMSEHFPFSPVGAALLCRWTDDDYGLGGSDGSMISMTVKTFKRQSDPTTHGTCCDSESHRCWTSGWPQLQRKRPATACVTPR